MQLRSATRRHWTTTRCGVHRGLYVMQAVGMCGAHRCCVCGCAVSVWKWCSYMLSCLPECMLMSRGQGASCRAGWEGICQQCIVRGLQWREHQSNIYMLLMPTIIANSLMQIACAMVAVGEWHMVCCSQGCYNPCQALPCLGWP